MKISPYWTKVELAVMHRSYVERGAIALAAVLDRTARAVEAKALELGLAHRRGGDQDALSAAGAARIAGRIAHFWIERGTVVRPQVCRVVVGEAPIYVVQLPPISAAPGVPRRRRRMSATVPRPDWPPGSNARLLARRDAHRRLHFVGGVLRGVL